MATIQKRNNSYTITVSCGYDMNGKQIRKNMTWKPDKGMTQRQIEKELKRQATLFEERCNSGQILDEHIKFAEFSEMLLNDVKKDLRLRTFARYKSMLPRINKAIGHLKLKEIQPPHLRAFYTNLAEGGIRLDTKYKCKIDIEKFIEKNKLSYGAFCRLSGLSNTTLISIRRGNNVALANAEKVCKALEKPLLEVFEPLDTNKPLSDETIRHHHRLISTMLNTAVKWGMLFSNPCDRTQTPKVRKAPPKYLDEVQAAELLNILENEKPSYRTAARVALFVGLRRGEVLGLKWADVDLNSGLMEVRRSLQYLPDRGLFEDKTKTEQSNRVIKLPQTVIKDLKSYRAWQAKQRFNMGDRWADLDFIFTNEEGQPIKPNTFSSWFSKLVKKHSDKIPYITVHSLRHTNATLQIAGGVPITTVAQRLGHTDSTTTGKIYAHAIKSADEAAAEVLENLLTPSKNRNAG